MGSSLISGQSSLSSGTASKSLLLRVEVEEDDDDSPRLEAALIEMVGK